MSAALPDRPAVRDELIFRQLDDEWVVYDPSGERLYVMNRTAAVVWLYCTGELTLDDIVVGVLDAFEGPADSEQVAADVRRAVAEFAERGLLT
jgi:hypothetical protein